MSTNEVREAAERLRLAQTDFIAAYGSDFAPMEAGRDRNIVINAYLAEHDPTPIDEAWLRSVGAAPPSQEDMESSLAEIAKYDAELLEDKLTRAIYECVKITVTQAACCAQIARLEIERQSAHKPIPATAEVELPDGPGVWLSRTAALREQLAECQSKLESAHDPNSVGNIAWLANQYKLRAEAAEERERRLREGLENITGFCHIDNAEGAAQIARSALAAQEPAQ